MRFDYPKIRKNSKLWRTDDSKDTSSHAPLLKRKTIGKETKLSTTASKDVFGTKLNDATINAKKTFTF